MRRFKILHRTYYRFSGPVTLGPHLLRLRPREDHELRIESSELEITPTASLRWHRDVEGNSIATASFTTGASSLAIESEVVVQQFNQAPLDFVVASDAVHHPFSYPDEDRVLLDPYLGPSGNWSGESVRNWAAACRGREERIQTYSLLERINLRIHETLRYQAREEPGVQSPDRTLALGSGSCRDFAALFMAAARELGLAARFVSGYLNAPPSMANFGATHAWVEIYLPGAGWKGFDPTIGRIAGIDNIPVAVARDPRAAPPIEGSFVGPPGSTLDVGVWVSEL